MQFHGTQPTFVEDLLSLLATFESMGNQFLEDNGDMLTLKTNVVMNIINALLTVNKVENICQRHVSDFIEEILKHPAYYTGWNCG